MTLLLLEEVDINTKQSDVRALDHCAAQSKKQDGALLPPETHQGR